MEPSSGEDGNLDAKVIEDSAECASMEPSSGEDGNKFVPEVWQSAVYALQWSRPQVRTETFQRMTCKSDCRIASMEPSSGEDGNMKSR